MQLTLYMLRADRAGDSWGLRESAAQFHEVATRPLDGIHVRLLVRQSDPRPPRWMSDLLGIVEEGGDDLYRLFNRHTGALLLVRHGSYRFVLAYGTAHHSIDRSHIEPGFGLKVVANSVAGERVISADTRGLAGRSRSQRTVLPSAGPLYELGIEPSEEWVRQLEGKPTVDFANAVAGGDCLKLRLRGFSLSHLRNKLEQIVERYESSDYKKDYEFLDYFRRVHRDDKATREGLELRLARLIRDQSTDISFAGPDVLEPLSVDHYALRYRQHRSLEMPELTHEAVYGALSLWQIDDPLRSVRIEAVDSSGGLVGEPYKLIDYIVADISMDEHRYTLSAGVWFLIDETYVEGVQRRIAAIPDITSSLALPPWDTTVVSGEDAYNAGVEARGWRLLDRRNFPIGPPNQKVEICDLLTPQKQLVCVKRMTKSATLSHLFAQGLVSAQLLVTNAEGYQDRVLDELRFLDPTAVFGSREDWTVVFGIATDKPGPLAESLFFFSKVNLDRTIRLLSGFGVKVALARIQLAGIKPKARAGRSRKKVSARVSKSRPRSLV